jgi:hypothetical protein
MQISPLSSHRQYDVRAVVLRAPSTSTTIWPGEFIEIAVPDGIPDNVYAINIIEGGKATR